MRALPGGRRTGRMPWSISAASASTPIRRTVSRRWPALDVPARELSVSRRCCCAPARSWQAGDHPVARRFDDDLSANAVEQYVSRLRKHAPYGLTVRTARPRLLPRRAAEWPRLPIRSAGACCCCCSCRWSVIGVLALLDTWREAVATANAVSDACWRARRSPSPSAWWSTRPAASRSTCPTWRSEC